ASVVSGNAVLASNADMTLNSKLNVLGAVSAATQGNIFIGGNLTGHAGISLIAGQNISTTNVGLSFISTSASPKGGDGGPITIVAGASFSETASQVTVTGGSATGGNIDFSTSAINIINSQGTSNGLSTTRGGDVTVAAFSTGSTGIV